MSIPSISNIPGISTILPYNTPNTSTILESDSAIAAAARVLEQEISQLTIEQEISQLTEQLAKLQAKKFVLRQQVGICANDPAVAVSRLTKNIRSISPAEQPWLTQQLSEAIAKEDVTRVESLLSQGVDPNMPDEEGHSALTKVISLFASPADEGYEKRHKILDMLFVGGADINFSRYAETPLTLAISNEITSSSGEMSEQNLKLVGRLLELGANPNMPNEEGFPALAVAMSLFAFRDGDQDHEICKSIIEALTTAKSTLIDCPDNWDTPLTAAIELGRLDVIGLILAAGADINKSCPQGDTPLIRAISKKKAAIVKKLLESGASPIQPDGNKWIPLTKAVEIFTQDEGLSEKGKKIGIRIMHLLLKQKEVHPDQIDLNGFTALRILLENGRNEGLRTQIEEVETILLDAGGSLSFAEELIEIAFVAGVWDVAGLSIKTPRLNSAGEPIYEQVNLQGSRDRENVDERFSECVDLFLETSSLNKLQQKLISDAFETSYPNMVFDTDEIMTRLQENRPVVVSSGPDGHAINFVIISIEGKKYAIMCNRGERSREEDSIEIYDMGQEIDRNFIEALGRRYPSKESFCLMLDRYFPEEKLIDSIDGPLKDQIIGNCPIASNEAAFYALVYSSLLNENEGKHSDEEIMEIKEIVQKTYNEFILFFQNKTLQRYMEYCQENGLTQGPLLQRIGGISPHQRAFLEMRCTEAL